MKGKLIDWGKPEPLSDEQIHSLARLARKTPVMLRGESVADAAFRASLAAVVINLSNVLRLAGRN